ncbi:T9SS type A sorting domain-containing protein [candidate division KSB1 bacterium]|nr:T9SS type A sorting domain-containing protein [candidate division KSB1 bacterium]
MKNLDVVLMCVITFSFQLYGQNIPYNQEFQVNTYTDCYQTAPAISALPDGGFVICWDSFFQDGYGDGIFAQKFDKNYQKIGNEFQVNTYFNSNQFEPTIAAFSDGGFIICWIGHLAENFGDGIFAQKFDKNGQKIGDEFLANTYTNSYQSDPKVVVLSNDGFVICWATERGIFALQYDKNVQKYGEEFKVNSYNDLRTRKPAIIALSNGGFAVCWALSYRYGAEGGGIFAQRFTENGQKIGDEFQVNSIINGREDYPDNPDIVSQPKAGFIICWRNKNSIYTQRFDENGQRFGDEFHVNTYNDFGAEDPAITALSDSGFVVCWESYGQDGSQSGVFGQRFNNNGEKTGPEFQVNTYTENRQEDPCLATLPDGGIIVCWESDKQDGSDDGVFGKYYFEAPIQHHLTPFSLGEPLNDATVNVCDPKFMWSQASAIHECYPWEITYDLYIDTDYNFSTSDIITGIQDTTYLIDSLTTGHTHFWKVLAHNLAGDSLWSSEVNGFYIRPDAKPTPVNVFCQNTPATFTLHQNYPNPFNATTTIRYDMPTQSHVTLRIYDTLGRLVVELVNAEGQAAGAHAVVWDGTDNSGRVVPSGLYVYALQTETSKVVKKMVVLE